ncbi:Dbl homology domain-containing protein [Backusella circina FSU 941]|nr:Dbl homology domain-containing protein [Backusella circina FSU 941]
MESITRLSSENTTRQWRQDSTGSMITMSSGGSGDSFDSSSGSSHLDQIPYLNYRSSRYYQLIDDLAIIDEIYQTFEGDTDSEPYERQVADTARNVAQKKYSADQLCQSEENFVSDLAILQNVFMIPLMRWVDEPANSNMFEKYKGLCSLPVLNSLFQHVNELTKAHQDFYRIFRERLKMWGPTQFISDIFSNFYESMSIYASFLNNYPSTIITLDTLYKNSSSFSKLLENCVTQAHGIQVKDFLYYLKTPIARLPIYGKLISQMAMATEPSHPDYRALISTRDKFFLREKEWRLMIEDRLSHMEVLEYYHSIVGNPATVNSTRRLFVSGILSRIELSDVQNAETRHYLLYNDIFMYCQKTKPSKKGNPAKLQYKGMINLKHADITVLSPAVITKLAAVRKASKLSFMRKSENNIYKVDQIFGFEIRLNEVMNGEHLIMGGEAYIIPGHTSGNGSKRHIIMRTHTEEEQNEWIANLQRVSKMATRKR